MIAERAVEGPSVGPLLLWDQPVGQQEDLAGLRQRHLTGNLAVWTPAEPFCERDATRADLLSDDDFWGVVEVMAGKLGEKAIAAASAALAQHDEDFILRWAETCASKALALAVTLEKPLEDYGFGALHQLGTVIGKGREVFDGFMQNRDAWDPRWVTNRSGSVLFLGSFALDRKLKHSVRVTTSFTPTHQRIIGGDTRRRTVAQERFAAKEGLGRAEVEAELGPDADMDAVVDFLESRGGELSAEGLAAVRGVGRPPHLRGLPGRLSMRAGRALIADGGIRMRIVLADITQASNEGRAALMRDALNSFGGVVCSEIEIGEFQYAGPLDADLFVIKRRYRGTREQYLEHYELR